MAKTPWWKKILIALRFVAKEVEDGNIGAGRKTSKGGKIAGAGIDAMIDAILEETDEEAEKQ